jgi:hypothetical protein
MTDVPFPGPAEPDDAGEPVRELAELRQEPSARFMGNVMDGINARQTTTRVIEMSWWGVTHLILELIESLFRTIGVRDDHQDKE